MRDPGLTFEDLTAAAVVLRKYAAAVEAKLYINMKINEAHKAIAEANHLADILDEAAANLDTVAPDDAQ